MALSQFVIVTGFLKLDNKNVDSLKAAFDTQDGKLNYEECVLDETGLIAGLRFSNAAKADEFSKLNNKKQHNGRTLNMLNNLELVSHVVELLKGQKNVSSHFAGKSTGDQVNNMLVWVYRNLERICEYHESETAEQDATKFQTLADQINAKAQAALTQESK